MNKKDPQDPKNGNLRIFMFIRIIRKTEHSDKGKNNAHHNKADGCKQQLVVKLVLINRLRRAADTDAADRGQRTDDDSVGSDDDTDHDAHGGDA